MGLKHLFPRSTAPPAPNPALVDGPNWNDDHYFLDAAHAPIGALGDLPYRGVGGLVTLLAGAAGVLQSAGPGSVPAYTMNPTLTSLVVTGSIAAGSLVLTGGITIDAPELGYLDGVIPGTVLASKAVVVDANKDIASFRNLTATAIIVGPNPALSGAIRLPSNSYIYARNAANNADVPMLGLDGSDRVQLSTTGRNIAWYGHLLAPTDNTYDIGASGATRPRSGYFAGSVIVGTTPATTGSIRLGSLGGVYVRNAGNTGDISLIRHNASDEIGIGNGYASAIVEGGGNDNVMDLGTATVRFERAFLGTALVVGAIPATIGAIRLSNTTGIYWRNAANTADIAGISVDASNIVQLGPSQTSFVIGLGTTPVVRWGGTTNAYPALRKNSTAAILECVLGDASDFAGISAAYFAARPGGASALPTVGAVRMINGEHVYGRDSTNAVNIGLIGANATNQVVLSVTGHDIKWSVPLVALGGGAAPTFGTIGATGPAVAAQHAWLRVIDASGVACWLPVWK